MFTKLHLIDNPNGTLSFVGRVPAELAYEFECESDLRAAAQCGPGIARAIAQNNGRVFKSRVYHSREEAAAFAHLMGHDIH